MSALSLYGLKEVADVTFFNLDGTPAIIFDSLKVSTIEETADQAEARGGQGNSKLIVWDFGKDITLTLEDALYSMKSLALTHGSTVTTNSEEVTKSKRFLCTTSAQGIPEESLPNMTAESLKYYDEKGKIVEEASLTQGTTYNAIWTENKTTETIVVTANSFPGVYKVVGQTYFRNKDTGKDEFFQFIIPQAKVKFEQTFTMQAEGDPSTLSMTLDVLRASDGEMIIFKKFEDEE